MGALISDVLSGAVTPSVCNAAVNAGGKLLKVVEMQHRYGTSGESGMKQLILCQDESEVDRFDRIERELADLKKGKRAGS